MSLEIAKERVYSSSSDNDSRAVVPISPLTSKQKRSSDNLEDEPQQPKKPQSDSIVVDSSPSSCGDEESIARQHRFTDCHPTQRIDDIYDKNDQSTINGFMGEADWHCAINSSQPGEGTSSNTGVAQTRNKRDVAVSVPDKSQRLAASNKIGQKENVNHYSRPNKESGIKSSSTYDPSLASFSRKKLVLQETSKSIREVESQKKKEFSTKQICDKQLIPKLKPSTSSTKPSNKDLLQLRDVRAPPYKKSKANSVMTPQSPVKPFTAKIFADRSESRGSSKKRIDDGGPMIKPLKIDSRSNTGAIITQPRQNIVMDKCNCSVVNKLILKKLAELFENQKTLAADVRKLLEHIKTEAQTPTTTRHDIVQLPVTSVAEWNILMQVLKSEANKQIIVNDFSRLGGSDLADIVKRIMREVVTDEFGARFVGWMGQHGKYPVFGTKLMDVIVASVDRSLLLPSATRKQVEGATMNYIHRFNQRFSRAKTQVADDKDGSDKGDMEKTDDDDALHNNNIENRIANVSDIESDNNADDPDIINSSENSD